MGQMIFIRLHQPSSTFIKLYQTGSNVILNSPLIRSNVCLAVVDEVNDLGVVIDSRLTFHAHIRKHVVRASVRANIIHRYFISRDVFTQIRAFKVYVRPTLEYASCTWSPHRNLEIEQVETIQRKFTKPLNSWVRVTMLQGEVVAS